MKLIYRGKNVRSAIAKGLKKLDLSKDEVDIEILQEKPLIFFGLFGGGTKVKLKPKSAAALADWKKTCEGVKEYARMTVSLIDDKAQIDVTKKKKKEKVEVNIKSKESKRIIGSRGSTLDAVEYILNLVIKRNPATRVDVSVDCDGYRRGAVGKIKENVKKAALKAKKENRPVKLRPMDSQQRRIAHREVNDIKGVESESSGNGKSRSVIIKRKR